MATPIFPSVFAGAPWMGFPGVDWGMKKSPYWKTGISAAVSGREARTIYWAAPIYHFQLMWEFVRDSGYDLPRNATRVYPQNEYQTLLGWYNQRKGMGEPFFITDPTDSVVGPTIYQTLVASAEAGKQDIQLVRTLGGSTEPVGGLDVTSTPIFKVNGTSIGGAYTANSPYDGWIKLTTPLNATDVVTGTFRYYFKVRFGKDNLDFSQFWRDFWEAKEIIFIGVRP